MNTHIGPLSNNEKSIALCSRKIPSATRSAASIHRAARSSSSCLCVKRNETKIIPITISAKYKPRFSTYRKIQATSCAKSIEEKTLIVIAAAASQVMNFSAGGGV